MTNFNARSTDAEFNEYVNTFLFPSATNAEIDVIAKLYPSDPALGSPFGTGDNFVLWPQYKRLAALQGDVVSYAWSLFKPTWPSAYRVCRGFMGLVGSSSNTAPRFKIPGHTVRNLLPYH